MEDIEFMDELNNPTNMRVVASKLLYKLMEKWRPHAYEIQEQQESSINKKVTEEKVQDGAATHPTASSTLVAANSETSAYTGAGDDCILSIVPVQFKSKKGSEVVETYAFMDPGSSAMFCTDALARQLNLQGRCTELELRTMSPKHHVESYLLTDLEVSGIDCNTFIDLPKVYTQESIPVSTENIPSQQDIEKWPYLSEVRIPSINADVGLLIGSNVHKALEPWQVINSRGNGPYGVRTTLGWTVNGPLRDHTNTDSENCGYSQATVNRISVENVEQLLLQQYNQDFLCDDKVEMS